MKKNIVCRPCKEQAGTWEIVDENGKVMPKHYNSKNECITAANKYACEASLEVTVMDNNNKKSM